MLLLPESVAGGKVESLWTASQLSKPCLGEGRGEVLQVRYETTKLTTKYKPKLKRSGLGTVAPRVAYSNPSKPNRNFVEKSKLGVTFFGTHTYR